MARRKPPSPADKPRNWKHWALGAVFGAIILATLWISGVFKPIFAGPKIPIERRAAEFALGTPLEEVRKAYPALKKKLRRFNDDKEFLIATLEKGEGLKALSSVDLLFYKDQLYFISAMWNGDQALTLPFDLWAKQYRRWRLDGGGGENLGGDVLLKEWRFNDGRTEMTLRDLSFTGQVQRWQDLRDTGNAVAHQAFAKYRLDGNY